MSNRDLTRSSSSRGVTPLSEAMNQLFRDAYTTPFGLGTGSASTGINLYEANDCYILQALLPGVNPDHLNITARENVLTLRGKTELAAPEGARGIVITAATGDFQEQIQLPGDIDTEAATADYHNGVLTLTLPKAAHAKVRTIRVGQGQGQQPAIEGRKK
jgi:HSP20 family protein